MYVTRPIAALCLMGILSTAFAQDKTIKQQCAKDWPTDYSMQKYCINKQVDSVNRLKRAWKELKEGTEEYNIMVRCYKQWPTSVGGYDHNMVLYCLNKQLAAYRELKQ